MKKPINYFSFSLSDREEKPRSVETDMAIAARSLPFALVAQVLGVAAIILVLIWTISFRGGLAWEATNKNLIFNVRLPSLKKKQFNLISLFPFFNQVVFFEILNLGFPCFVLGKVW